MHRSDPIRRITLGTTLLTAVLVAACSGDSRTSEPATVIQETFRFTPRSVHVGAGSSITWLNRDAVDHTITSGSPAHQSNVFDRPLGKEASVVIAFAEPGTFPYFCSIHNSMRGEVVVT